MVNNFCAKFTNSQKRDEALVASQEIQRLNRESSRLHLSNRVRRVRGFYGWCYRDYRNRRCRRRKTTKQRKLAQVFHRHRFFIQTLQLRQDLPRPMDHRLGQPRQLGDMDPEALVRRALPQLDRRSAFPLPLPSTAIWAFARRGKCPEAASARGSGSRTAFAPRSCWQIHSSVAPRDAHTVVGARPAADLVQNDQRARVRVMKDVRELAHLDHERTLPARIASCAPMRVYNEEDRAPACGRRRHGRADLPEDHDQRHLAHDRRFTAHVRAGDQQGEPRLSGESSRSFGTIPR